MIKCGYKRIRTRGWLLSYTFLYFLSQLCSFVIILISFSLTRMETKQWWCKTILPPKQEPSTIHNPTKKRPNTESRCCLLLCYIRISTHKKEKNTVWSSNIHNLLLWHLVISYHQLKSSKSLISSLLLASLTMLLLSLLLSLVLLSWCDKKVENNKYKMDYKNKNDIIFVVVFPLLFCSHGGQSFILVLLLLFYTTV